MQLKICSHELFDIYSGYTPPTAIKARFEDVVDNLVLDAKHHSPKIIDGDFNLSEK